MGSGIYNIQVRVMAANARRVIAGLQTQLAAAEAQTIRTAAVSPVGKKSFSDMTRLGNQMQWTGRQLQYNFTLPLLLAGGAAVKFQLDQEKAMVHVAKVYGDTAEAASYWAKNHGDWMEGASSATEQAGMVFEAELSALEKSFDALSERYGVQKKEVIEVAGAWAAAGVSGEALAKSVDNTLTAVAIGGQNATKATEALISIQAQYNMSADEMMRSLADLNAIENATAADMQGLITAMQATGSVAASAGISARELAAMISGITPAAGTASKAGNALRTIIVRMNGPLATVSNGLKMLGINSKDASWQLMSGTEKIKLMAKSFGDLTDSEKNYTAGLIAGTHRVTQFTQLMEDMGREHGYYNKALDATSSKQKSFNTLNKELNAVLESNPKRLERIGVALQNSMADVIQGMIPYIIYLADVILNVVKAFQGLDPALQKFLMWTAIFMVVMPMVLRYMGSLRTLFVTLGFGIKGVATLLGIQTAATKAQIEADKLAGIETATRRKGLLGLISVMLLTPFRWFGNAAGAAMGLASSSFTFMYNVAATSISNMVTTLLPQFSGFISGMVARANSGGVAAAFASMWAWIVGLFSSGGKAVVAAQAASTGAVTAIIALGARTRLGIETATAATSKALTAGTLALEAGAASTEVAIWKMTYAEREAMARAFTSWYIGLAQARNAALYGIEAGASSRILALEAGTSATRLGIASRGAAASTAAIAAGGAAKVGILATIAGKLRGIWSAAIAFLTNPAMILRALGGIVAAVGAGVSGIAAALLSPWGLAIAAIVTLVYAFRKQLVQIWNNIVKYFQDSGDLGKMFGWMADTAARAFNMLPQSISNAMLAVVKIVRAAALAVYGWFSYINPFAHHSPSLVENVTFGMKAVLKQFSTLGQIKAYTDGAYASLAKFGKATAGIVAKANAIDIKADRGTLSVNTSALKYYDELQAKLKDTRAIYARMGAEIQAYSKKDIKARRAMEDAIFANQYEQKKYQLQLMDMEDAVGTIDDVKSKLDELAGSQELLRGTQSDLRNAGAGSDITGFYDEQLAALEDQKASLQQSSTEMTDIQKKMSDLERAGQRLDLEKALKFDKVDYQLVKMQEQYDLIGDTISDMESGIRAAVGAQEQLNRAAEEGRSARESAKLANAAKKAGGAAGAAGTGVAQGDFPTVSGVDGLDARTDFESQVDDINKYTDEILAKTSGMFADINPFAKLKGWWDKSWSATKGAISASWDWMGNFFSTAFAGVNISMPGTDFISGMFDKGKISSALSSTFSVVTDFYALFWPDVKRYFIEGFEGLWTGLGSIAKQLAGFGGLFDPLMDTFKGLWDLIVMVAKVLGPPLAIIGGALLALAKVVTSAVGHTIGPLLKSIGALFGGLIKTLRGVARIIIGAVNLILGVLTNNPKLALDSLKQLAIGVWEIFSGIVQSIFSIFRGVWSVLSGIVQGIVGGIVGFFTWLWDVLVGHSIVPDIINGIIFYFKMLGSIAMWIWNNVLVPIYNFFVSIWTNFIMPAVSLWWTGLMTVVSVFTTIGLWFWNSVLKPIFDFFVSVWDNFILPAIKGWWGIFKGILNIFSTIGRWFWDSVLKPIYDNFKKVWDNHIKPAATGWWGGIKSAFNGLTTMATWVWDKVLNPVYSKFKDLFNKVGKWIKDNVTKITDPMKDMVNKVIGAINKMIDGLNMLNKLPGINFKVEHIPKLEEGGEIPNRRVSNGFITRGGARAIVGEGKPNHPEYVIPTDPTHRNRAMSLYQNLGKQLGVLDDGGTPAMDMNQRNHQGVPMYSIGGLIGKAAGGVKNVVSKVGGTVINVGGKAFDWAKGAVGTVASRIYNPIGKIVDGMINRIGKPLSEGAKSAHAKVRDVVFGTDDYMKLVREGVTAKEAKKWSKPLKSGYSIGGGLNSYRGHNGQDFPAPTGTPVYAINGGTVSSSRDIRGSGSGGYSSYGRMVEISHPGGLKSLSAHLSSRAVKTGQKVGGGQKIGNVGSTGNSTGPHLHLSTWQNGSLRSPLSVLSEHGIKMAKGAIVRATPGGVNATVGEGSHDEAVLPLPYGWDRQGGFGGKTIENNFYGDLVFPNVKNGDDAEEFIRNLESVVKD